MEMLQIMAKLQGVDIVIQEKINKIRGTMEVLMGNSHLTEVKIWREIFLWTLLNRWLILTKAKNCSYKNIRIILTVVPQQ